MSRSKTDTDRSFKKEDAIHQEDDEESGEIKEFESDGDEEDIDEELALPLVLRNISLAEKRELLAFKSNHNEREWEEELLQREEAISRKIDFERLQKMTKSSGNFEEAPKAKRSRKPNAKAVDSDEEGDNDRIITRKKRTDVTTSRKKAITNNIQDTLESEDDAYHKSGEMSVSDSEEPVVDENSEEEEEEEGGDDEDDDDDDNLFDSEEEEEITRRTRSSGGNNEGLNSSDLKKSSKRLGKGKRAEKMRRTKRRRARDSDDESEDSVSIEVSSSDDLGDEYRMDGNLKSIKNAFKKSSSKDVERSQNRRVSQSAPMIESLGELKSHYLKALEEEVEEEDALNEEPDANELATLDDICSIQVYRQQIVDVLNEPFMEKVLKGAFLRYSIGDVSSKDNSQSKRQIYRMCQIIDVYRDEKNKAYDLPSESISTNVKLKLCNAGEIKGGCRITNVSNHKITKDEFTLYGNGMKKVKKDMPLKKDVRLVSSRQKSCQAHAYSHDEIKDMVAKRNGISKVLTTEYTTAMDLLLKQQEQARVNDDLVQLELVGKTIEKLVHENAKQKEANEKMYKRQSDVNKRMRLNNVQRDMAAGIRKRIEDQEAAAKGVLSNTVADPFIRRETRPKILWKSSTKLSQEAEAKKADSSASDKNVAAAASDNKSNASSLVSAHTVGKGRVGTDDGWSIPLVVSIDEIRSKFKSRFGVDPVSHAAIPKHEKYLQLVCRNLPPRSSVERDQLRGKDMGLDSYLKQFSQEVSGR